MLVPGAGLGRLAMRWPSRDTAVREMTGFPFDCILDSCSSDQSPVSVLVPGAGLGRLAYEVAKQGYSCQGNDWLPSVFLFQWPVLYNVSLCWYQVLVWADLPLRWPSRDTAVREMTGFPFDCIFCVSVSVIRPLSRCWYLVPVLEDLPMR